MGSYGIGLGRLMGTVAEVLSDENGLVWPENIAPFKFHIIEIAGKESSKVKVQSEKMYSEMKSKGLETLLDDRETGAGQKFADSDLIGIPYRIVVSEKTIAEGKYEVKNRQTGEVTMLTEEEILEL